MCKFAHTYNFPFASASSGKSHICLPTSVFFRNVWDAKPSLFVFKLLLTPWGQPYRVERQNLMVNICACVER